VIDWVTVGIVMAVGVFVYLWSSNNNLWNKVEELEKRIKEIEKK
jgi:hypothetical protein